MIHDYDYSIYDIDMCIKTLYCIARVVLAHVSVVLKMETGKKLE